MRELREQLKAREQMSVFADRLSRVEGEKQALAAMLQSKTVMHPERVSALNSQTNKRPHPTRGGKTRTCYRCGNPNHLSFECKRQVSCTNCGRGNHMTQACRFQNGQKETRCNTCGRYGHSEETCFSNGYQRPLKFPRRDDNGWRTRNARGMGTNAPQQQNFQLRQGFQQQQNWQQPVSFMIPFSRTISFVMSPHLRFPFMEFFLLSSKACSIVCLRSILVRPQFISTQPVLCK